MNRWIVPNLARRGERFYRLPRRCPRCNSRDIWADVRDGFVHEQCAACDHNRQIRLLRAEIESAAADVFDDGEVLK